MNRDLRWLAAGLCTAAGLLFIGRGDAGGDKGSWQPILSKEIYQEIAKREADIVREKLKGPPDEKALSRAKLGAVLLAALTLSVKDGAPEELRANREAALLLAAALNKKDIGAAQKLAASLPNGKPGPAANMADINWGSLLQPADLMDHYGVQKKGGDGMHPDLQSNIRLKGALNSIEEKIRALAMKELAAAGMEKEAKELALLGYRSAVVGSLTYYYAPAAKKGAKDPQEWRKLSLEMRDNCISLAKAAQKGDTAAVFKVSGNLNSTCTQCHALFRN